MWRNYFVDLVRYHAWANEILFDALDRFGDAQRKADHQLFFRSMHHTVDHVLLVNRLWMGRVTGHPIEADFTKIQIDDWETLKQALRNNLADMAEWLQKQDEFWFIGNLGFTAGNGKANVVPVVSVLTHMLTHFNHHRGQVSAVVTRLGGNAPEMDYLYYLRAKSG